MEKWILKNKCSNYKELGDFIGVSDVVAKIGTNRGHITPNLLRAYVNPSFESQYNPYLFHGMKKAIDIVVEAINCNKKIAIVGDYDVDGIMSSAILFKVIKRCGGEVINIIPDRVLDGYGINVNIITDLYMLGVDLIITCDNGVSAFEAIEAAKEEGMSVVVLDHHEFKYEENDQGVKVACYVNADAIVNPQNPKCEYPFKKLCAGYISYKFGSALYQKYNLEMEEELFIFGAIATICDVVDLVDENRYVVKEALKKVQTIRNIGLNKLIRATGLEGKELGAYHMGFIIGPCLNASGRLENAMLALELLTTESEERAEELAGMLVKLNIERRAMTEEGEKDADKIVNENNDTIKILYLPNTHESIAGIIAGRLKEKYYHPFIVLTNSNEGYLKGSARSVEAINIIEEISKCDYLLKKYGGHPMAAGLSLEKENLEKFRIAINSEYENFNLEKIIPVDIILDFNKIDENLVKELNSLEPYGKGNEKPVLAQTNVEILSFKEIGKEKQFLKMEMRDRSGTKVEGLYFGRKKEELLDTLYRNTEIDIIFSISINEYMGKIKIQIIIDNYRISADKG